jgi:UDP-2,4-diacetamido-2,4,6-trideoxy-beta-L-altropyranose hydrolase
MKIAFRVDASAQIGTGHFMRCLTLAIRLVEKGAKVRFVSHDLPEHFQSMLEARNCEFYPLDSEGDIVDTLASLRPISWDLIVVDHYKLDRRWESAMRSIANRVLVIDDVANRVHDCDFLLDQNYYADAQSRYLGITPPNCNLLLGPKYALLGREYLSLRPSAKIRCAPAKSVLVFFGGSDMINFTKRAITALAPHARNLKKVNVVIGLQHPNINDITRQCDDQGFECHIQTSRMAELIVDADLAIGAGGANTWERCSLGLPSLVVAVADNQIRAAQDIAMLEITKFLGASEDITHDRLSREIELAMNSEWLEIASRKGMDLVDANGSARIVQLLECQ